VKSKYFGLDMHVDNIPAIRETMARSSNGGDVGIVAAWPEDGLTNIYQYTKDTRTGDCECSTPLEHKILWLVTR
jgi:hypothetical protein